MAYAYILIAAVSLINISLLSVHVSGIHPAISETPFYILYTKHKHKKTKPSFEIEVFFNDLILQLILNFCVIAIFIPHKSVIEIFLISKFPDSMGINLSLIPYHRLFYDITKRYFFKIFSVFRKVVNHYQKSIIRQKDR
ncbi:unnamed protein product [Onchocerca flexuosa]|uniref:Sodium:proton antiporter n=1 Tax=Onchocerca flexuosa TaxID=387005 RepID=A0A183HCA4_9BILA|nr:unnamed protein product [Onchocerca flexuosa]